LPGHFSIAHPGMAVLEAADEIVAGMVGPRP
jgi:hypothetical protein